MVRIATSNYHDQLNHMFKRALSLRPAGTETFFLWGPRQTGKATLLRQVYPDARWVDVWNHPIVVGDASRSGFH